MYRCAFLTGRLFTDIYINEKHALNSDNTETLLLQTCHKSACLA